MKKKAIHILLFLLCAGCFKESDYDPSNRNLPSLFTLSATNASVPADGTSRTQVIVSNLPLDISDSDNNVIFETDYGVFEANNLKKIIIPSALLYDSSVNSLNREAIVKLISEIRVDSVHLKATVKGVPKTVTVYFKRAYPDKLKVIPSTIFTKASHTTGVNIEVDLLRDTGTVSFQTPVDFTVTDSTGKIVGEYQLYRNLSDSNGKCSFNYFFSDTTFQGRLLLKASTSYPDHNPLPDSIYLTIYK